MFKTLGLQFDLTNVGDGKFTLGHTDTRRQELLEQIRHMTQNNGTFVNTKNLKGSMADSFGSMLLFSGATSRRQ